MKEYVRLSIDAMAYYSGNTYYEEVFLPKEVWEEIEENFKMYTYLCGFDGKHSEVKVDIEIEEFNEKHLMTYTPCQSNDGETLFEHIYEYLDEEKYDNTYLWNVQGEVMNLCQVEKMVIKFERKNKDVILDLLRDYIL